MGKAKKLKVSKQNTVTTGVYCFRKLAMLENNSLSLSGPTWRSDCKGGDGSTHRQEQGQDKDGRRRGESWRGFISANGASMLKCSLLSSIFA